MTTFSEQRSESGGIFLYCCSPAGLDLRAQPASGLPNFNNLGMSGCRNKLVISQESGVFVARTGEKGSEFFLHKKGSLVCVDGGGVKLSRDFLDAGHEQAEALVLVTKCLPCNHGLSFLPFSGSL